MKLALLGYGKMGKAIEKVAKDRGHEIILKTNSSTLFSPKSLKDVDVAIEFSTPNNAPYNILTCFDADVPVVVGTTGWYNEFELISKRCKEEEQAMLYATNFSIGVNIFFEINRRLAQLMSKQTQYNLTIEEIHHTEKLDAPSGTAISLAQQIIENNINYKQWEKEQTTQPKSIPIESKRIENVAGTHIVSYDSNVDTLEIKHTAKNREGFALGAVLGAEFLKDKKGIFTMKDVLDF